MRIEIHIELDEEQHKPEEIDALAKELEFAVNGAVGLFKLNERPRKDFDFEVHAEYYR